MLDNDVLVYIRLTAVCIKLCILKNNELKLQVSNNNKFIIIAMRKIQITNNSNML